MSVLAILEREVVRLCNKKRYRICLSCLRSSILLDFSSLTLSLLFNFSKLKPIQTFINIMTAIELVNNIIFCVCAYQLAKKMQLLYEFKTHKSIPIVRGLGNNNTCKNILSMNSFGYPTHQMTPFNNITY